jgi:hypothetical protein
MSDDVIEVEALARRVGGMEEIKKAIQDALDRDRKSRRLQPGDSGEQRGGPHERPRRHLFALVLAHPADDYAKSNIFPREGFFDAQSGEDMDVILPGFAAADVGSFNEELFDQVLKWLEKRFPDFEYRGLTTVVVFASNTREKAAIEPIDDSAVLFFDLEMMQEERFIAGPQPFFMRLFQFARRYPGDDAFWEFRNDLNESTMFDAVSKEVFRAISEGIPSSVTYPVNAIRRCVAIRRHTKIHRGVED